MKQRSHKFVVKISFGKPLTREEALYAVRNSGSMGKGATDFYLINRQWNEVDGEMKITGLQLAKDQQ